MGIKLKPNITVNIARIMDYMIMIYHRDGKRIIQHKVWNSIKIHYDGDSFICVMLVGRVRIDGNITHWLLYLEDLKNGETRVTPMYEVEYVKHSHTVVINNDFKHYEVFKKK